jgi:hypothetical protein
MATSETGTDFNPNRAGGAGSGDTGDDAPYDPATRTGDPSASGNPGANNPGVGDLGAGEAGVTMDPGVARGFANPGNVGTGASSVMGAGGIGGTGVAGGVAPEQVQVAAGTGDPDAAGAAPPLRRHARRRRGDAGGGRRRGRPEQLRRHRPARRRRDRQRHVSVRTPGGATALAASPRA